MPFITHNIEEKNTIKQKKKSYKKAKKKKNEEGKKSKVSAKMREKHIFPPSQGIYQYPIKWPYTHFSLPIIIMYCVIISNIFICSHTHAHTHTTIA